MKNIFYILLLLPTIIFAQYPSNSGQKITLGEQSTADGLVWRGIRADTTSKIVPFSDTSAYIILDTIEKTLWLYKAGQIPKWQQVGGSAGGSTLDTAFMLTNYYRAGRSGIIQASDVPTLNQNTTGSAATLTTGRTIQTNLASTSAATFNGSANITPGITGVLPIANGGTGQTTLAAAGINTGSGSLNYIPKYTGTTTLGSSLIYDNGSTVSITSVPGYTGYQLQISGTNARIVMINNSASNTSNYSQMAFGNGTAEGQYAEFYRQNDIKTFHIYNGGSGKIGLSTRLNNGYVYDIYLNEAGNVGIGTTSPTEKLHVVGNARITAMNNVGDIGASSTGVLQAAGVSDVNLKNTIENSAFGLNEILLLNPVTFFYNDLDRKMDSDVKDVGFIAQDVFEIIPNAVSSMGDGYLQIDYKAITATLVKAMQEQQALIKALEQRILILENK